MSTAWSRMREALASLVRWFAPNGGGEARRLSKLLERESHLQRTPKDATHGEQVVALSVIGTANRLLRSAMKRLSFLQHQLLAAAAAAVDAEQVRRQFDSRPRLEERADREREHRDRQQAVLSEKIDQDVPTVPAPVLLAVEAVIVLVEVGFWYAFFARDIDHAAPDAGILQVGAVGLAVLLPLVALMSAHFAGAMWQRLVKHRSRERLGQQVAGAATSLAIVAVLTGLVYWLVDFRFSFRSPYALQTTSAAPPPDALALLFASTIVVVATVRTFMTSEVHQQRTARDRVLSADRVHSDRLDAAVLKANAAFAAAWYRLAAGTDRVLVDIEQIVAAGERVLLIARSRRADAAFLTPRRSPRLSGSPSEWLEEDVTLPWHLMIDLLDTQLLPIRRSLQVLQDHRPAVLMADEQLKGLERRLAAVMAAGSTPAPPSDPDRSEAVAAAEENSGAEAEPEVIQLPRSRGM